MADEQRPQLRVVSGDPSDEDLAVLTALLAARGGSGDGAPAPARGRFADPARMMRTSLVPGPGAWRASAG